MKKNSQGEVIKGALAHKQVAPSRRQAASDAVQEATNAAFCPMTANAPKTDMIELFDAEGDLKRSFPDIYAMVDIAFTKKRAGALMDEGVRHVMLVTQGSDEKGGHVSIIPMQGNTGQLMGILSQIREDLQKAEITVTQDPEQRCPSFGGASRGLRLAIPPRR